MKRLEIEWRDDAECRDMDVEVFFPDPSDDPGKKRAMAVCKQCPVRQECLEDALRIPHKKDHGILGGTMVWQRERIRMERRRAA